VVDEVGGYEKLLLEDGEMRGRKIKKIREVGGF
jgi:hypothetical protein